MRRFGPEHRRIAIARLCNAQRTENKTCRALEVVSRWPVKQAARTPRREVEKLAKHAIIGGPTSIE